MTASGRVRAWHDEDGWGGHRLRGQPGRVLGALLGRLHDWFRTLEPGQAVTFTFEAGEQDGYHFRAVQVWSRWRPEVVTDIGKSGPDVGYQSKLHLDDDAEGAPPGPLSQA